MTTAVLDACVLYSAMLRDLFMRLAVGAQMETHRTALKNPSRTPDDYLERLVENGLHQTAVRLKAFQEQI